MNTEDNYSTTARMTAARALFDVLNPGIQWNDADALVYLEAVDRGLADLDTNGSGDLLSSLRAHYPTGLNPGYVSAKIEHAQGRVFFVTVRRTGEPVLYSETTTKVDLSFITDGGQKQLFTVMCSPNENARIFLEKLTAFDLVNYVDIFTLAATTQIIEAYKG